MNGDRGNGDIPFEGAGDVKGLSALRTDLQPETREFVTAMRRLFAQTGKSVRGFAAYHHFSAASVSRYLSGGRLPDKVFVDALLKSACQARRVQLVPEMQEYAYRLHREALFTEQPARYRLQMESDKLEEALLAAEQAELAIGELKSSVSDQKHELERLEQQKRELTRAAAREREHSSAQIARYRGRERDLEEQCGELREEIDRLEAALSQAEYERDEAEARCRELEDKLSLVEEDAEREELQAQVDEVREEISAAEAQAAARLDDLKRAESDAEAIRRRAEADALAKREEANSLFEETRAKAAQAAADFETNLAKRREQSERDLAARQAKAEERLSEIESRAEQLGVSLASLQPRDDAEPVVRDAATFPRQPEATVHEAQGKAIEPFWFAVPEARWARPSEGQPFLLAPGTWYLAVGWRGKQLIAEDRATGARGVLTETEGIQRASY